MKEQIGFEINIPEGSKIVHVPVSKELQKYFKEEVFTGKSHIDYLKEFLATKKNFNVVNGAFLVAMKDALPECLKTQCLYCNGESDEEADKACQKYYLQMQVTFVVAANEFVRIILSHQYIYKNKQALYNVTQDFFRSLVFIKGEGKMYFDLDAICRHILKAGFFSLSEMFAKSKPLQNLQVINDSIDDLEKRKLENEIFAKEDEDYLELQHKFFENKQRYYKEKLFLEEKGAEVIQYDKPYINREKEKNIPIIVLYYYYLQAGGYFPYFENHSKGKIKAIDELIVKDNIQTTAKYFQIQYNKINNHKSNRIAKNKVSNIEYVANQMLNEYPKAKEIALSELKEALTKNR
jgi:hypothetical protein